MNYSPLSELDIKLGWYQTGPWYSFAGDGSFTYENFRVNPNIWGEKASERIGGLTEEKYNKIIADGLSSHNGHQLRIRRNRLLELSDRFALADMTLTPEMVTYRQALRDLPETVDMNNIVYPEKPE